MTAASAAAQSADGGGVATPSVRSLFTGVAGDAGRLATLRNVEVLGVGGAFAFASRTEDAELTRRVAASGAEEPLDGGEVIGGGLMQVGGAVAAYVVGRMLDSGRTATIGAELIRAQLLNSGLTQGLKLAVHRTRPDRGRYSFPSGHSSASFATATIIEREFGWKAGVAAYSGATYVAVSRLSENRHFASDVIFGAALGIVSGRAVRLSTRDARVAVTPFVTGDRLGVDIAVLGR